MTINAKDTDLQRALNRGNANTLPAALQKIAFGDVLRTMQVTLRKRVPALDSYNLATVLPVGLKEDARAASIVSAYARVGTAAAGPLTVAAHSATPTTTQIAVSPNGEIVTLGTDAYTDVDVTYLVEKGDVKEVTIPVASNAILFPAPYAGKVVLIIEAEATKGTVTGKKIILAPSASAAATGQARLDLAKTSLKFASADAVTEARVKLLVVSDVDVDALLETDTGIY